MARSRKSDLASLTTLGPMLLNDFRTYVVEANPQQENNFVFLSPFHSIFVIYTPSMLSERVLVSSCSEKKVMCFVTR